MAPEPSTQWLDIAKATMTIVTPIFTGLWFLIKRWGAMQEKIKRLQAHEVLISVDTLKASLVETKQYLSVVANSLNKTREEIVAVKTRLEVSTDNSERFLTAIEKVKAASDFRINHLEETLKDGELVRVGPNQVMFKGRKKE